MSPLGHSQVFLIAAVLEKVDDVQAGVSECSLPSYMICIGMEATHRVATPRWEVGQNGQHSGLWKKEWVTVHKTRDTNIHCRRVPLAEFYFSLSEGSIVPYLVLS